MLTVAVCASFNSRTPMLRINTLASHLVAHPCSGSVADTSSTYPSDVDVALPPRGLEKQFARVLTPQAVAFVAEMHRTFDTRVSQVCAMCCHSSARVIVAGVSFSFYYSGARTSTPLILIRRCFATALSAI